VANPDELIEVGKRLRALSDADLEALLRRGAEEREQTLVIEERGPDDWFAGFVTYDDPAVESVTHLSAQASTRRTAVEELAFGVLAGI
jgi:hypothetical protein